MTFSFRVVTQHKVYTCALIITALAVTQNVFVMGKKTSYSLKDPIGPRSAYVQELIDSNANIEHILQVMRPERLKDKQQTKQTPISLTSTQGENVETTLEVSATTFSNNDYITIYLKTNGSAGKRRRHICSFVCVCVLYRENMDCVRFSQIRNNGLEPTAHRTSTFQRKSL